MLPVPTESSLEKETVFDLYNQLKEAIILESRMFLKVGAILSVLTKKKRFRQLGSHVHTKNDFFKEIGMSRASAYNYIRTWEVFGEYVMSNRVDIPHKKLIEILPVCKDIKQIPEWMDKAIHLTPQDFKDEINIAKGGVGRDHCTHDFELWQRCKKCRMWFPVGG